MNKKIYLVTKLFNVHDRLASLELCNAIDQWIENGEIKGYDKCFLPYRDSNEKIKGKPNPNWEIFKLDCAQMRNSDILLGYFDGPSYDSGISFELGYSCTFGVSATLITTDYFQVIDENGPLSSISPLVSSMAQIIHVRNNEKQCLNYQEAQNELLEQARTQIKNILVSADFNMKHTICPDIKETRETCDFFIDRAFIKTESGRLLLQKFTDELSDQGISFHIPSREESNNVSSLMKSVNTCKNILVHGDAWEVPVDSAILQGMACGLDKSVILYSSRDYKLHQSDEFQLYKNSMLLGSAIKIINNLNLEVIQDHTRNPEAIR